MKIYAQAKCMTIDPMGPSLGAVTEYAVQNWMEAHKELPEPGGLYIASFVPSDGNRRVCSLIYPQQSQGILHLEISALQERNGAWSVLYGESGGVYPVTHWRVFPQPPVEEKI